MRRADCQAAIAAHESAQHDVWSSEAAILESTLDTEDKSLRKGHLRKGYMYIFPYSMQLVHRTLTVGA